MAVDYRLMLSRLRPGSEYHWMGTSDDPADAEAYAAIGEWRDPDTTKPTKAELDAEWTVYEAELAAAAQQQILIDADKATVTADAALGLLAQIAARRQQIAAEIALVGPRAAQIASDLALIPGRQTQITSDLTLAANATAAQLKALRDRQLNAESAMLNVLGRALNAEETANAILGRALNAEDELYEQVLVPLIRKLRRL